MQRTLRRGGWLVVALCLLGAGTLPAQEDQPAEMSEEEMAKMSEMMGALATPGKPHQVLDAMAGKWKVTSRAWMPGPEAEPEVSEAHATYEWIFDRRFLVEKIHGTMMEAPFEGMGIFGYDNYRQEYQLLWLDNMGTVMLTARGSYDEATRTLTLRGLMDQPPTGERDKKIDYVVRIDDDQHVFAITDVATGTTMLEVTYVRE